jgi:hypothetical protein
MSRTSDQAARPRTQRSDGTATLILAQFSTRVPPELLERLRIAAPQLGLTQSQITAVALHAFLARKGF